MPEPSQLANNDALWNPYGNPYGNPHHYHINAAMPQICIFIAMLTIHM